MVRTSDFLLFKLNVNGYPLVSVFWNLLLLAPSYYSARYLTALWDRANLRNLRHKLLFFIFFFVWLLFIPNSAYIISEVRHILDFCPDNFYHICLSNAWIPIFFFVYGLIGWLAFAYLLGQMRELIIKIKGRTVADILILSIIPMVAAGVILGLMGRFNSWEIFVHPVKIANLQLNLFLTQEYLKNLFFYILFFYLLYFTGNRVLKFDKS